MTIGYLASRERLLFDDTFEMSLFRWSHLAWTHGLCHCIENKM